MMLTHFSPLCAVRVAALLLICLSAAPARAERLFLFIEDAGRGIAGESTERAHPNWIVLESFMWGISPEGNSPGVGGPTSKPKFSAVRLVKRVDRSSATLATGAASGKRFPRAILEVCREGRAGAQCYYRVTLNDVLIASYQIGGSTASAPTEEIGISFGRVRWEYFIQAPDGRMLPGGTGGYDILQGKLTLAQPLSPDSGGRQRGSTPETAVPRWGEGQFFLAVPVLANASPEKDPGSKRNVCKPSSHYRRFTASAASSFWGTASPGPVSISPSSMLT